MTGPEHYREAERMLAVAAEDSRTWSNTYQGSIAAAQVHATLALAAAAAADQASAYDGDELGQRSRAWAGVA